MNFGVLMAKYDGPLKKTKVSLAEQQALVNRVWSANPRLRSDLSAIVDSGPMAITGEVRKRMQDHIAIFDLVRVVAYRATNSYAAFGEYKSATELVILANKIGDRLISAIGDFVDYLAAIIDFEIANASTEVKRH